MSAPRLSKKKIAAGISIGLLSLAILELGTLYILAGIQNIYYGSSMHGIFYNRLGNLTIVGWGAYVVAATISTLTGVAIVSRSKWLRIVSFALFVLAVIVIFYRITQYPNIHYGPGNPYPFPQK